MERLSGHLLLQKFVVSLALGCDKMTPTRLLGGVHELERWALWSYTKHLQSKGALNTPRIFTLTTSLHYPSKSHSFDNIVNFRREHLEGWIRSDNQLCAVLLLQTSGNGFMSHDSVRIYSFVVLFSTEACAFSSGKVKEHGDSYTTNPTDFVIRFLLCETV